MSGNAYMHNTEIPKNMVAAACVPAFRTNVRGDCFQIINAPIARVTAHCFQRFGVIRHGTYDITGNII